MATLRAWSIAVLFLLWTLPLMPVQLVLVALGLRGAAWLPVYYHRVVCYLLGVHVEVRGTPHTKGPTLFASNHVSWLDIPVLSTVAPVSFIAKHEIAGWAFFGWLAKLQRSVFIERKARRTADHRDEMMIRLEKGDNLVLFPEGTSGDGIHVLAYKSAFFALAEKRINGRPLTVQPVSIALSHLDHMPVGRRSMSVYAWVGDQDLLPHLWRFLKSGPTRVVVEFHPPVTIEQFRSRKELCAHCRAETMRGVDSVLTGRPIERPQPQPPAPMLPPITAEAA
jgi:1-acyl-sn-glycerol-3-phosphate acyltransferase